MNLRTLRTGPRLGLGLGLILATCLLTLVVAFATLAADRAALLRTLDQASEQQALAVALRTALLSSAVSIRNMGLQTTVEGAQKHEAEALRQRKAQEAARNALATAAPPGAIRDSLARLTDIDQKMAAEFAEAVGLASQFNTEQAAKLITERIDPLLAQAVQELDAFATLQRQQADAAKQLADARSQRTALALGLASLALLGGAAILGWRLTLSITRPIAEALQTTQRVQAGDLDCEIRDQGHDEAAQLLRGLRAMRDGLAGIVRGVRASAENISTGAGEISAGNTDLSHRTESQAASLQQTAASIEQINAAVRSNADTARQASQLAGSACQAANHGGQVMDDVVAAMEQMRTESGRIGEIVGVIDGIAFQTNILALNAAVEAARAGEQGRGFAVVASEVRTLAGRSASAAREIKSLIAASAARVAAGSQLVDTAGNSVKDIVSQVQGVAGLLGQISASAAEQTRGIGQINQAIVQLDHVTQQNAALVEEAAAAAASLDQQAAGMVSAVSVFKLH